GIDLAPKKQDTLGGARVGELYGRPGSACARVAVVLAPRLDPLHVLRGDAELMLEHAPDPERRRLLIVADREPFALEILRVVHPDARRPADDDVRVGEIAVVEYRQESIGEALRPLDQKRRKRHLG